MAKCYLGIDVGSVSTNIVVLDEEYEVLVDLYLRTGGQPLQAVPGGLRRFAHSCPMWRWWRSAPPAATADLRGDGGSGCDQNELPPTLWHPSSWCPMCGRYWRSGAGLKNHYPGDGVVVVCHEQRLRCRYGFVLDRQASRLGVPISVWRTCFAFSKSGADCGRCVFAESDMIHKQQTGHSIEYHADCAKPWSETI